jgi:hypothetical protein
VAKNAKKSETKRDLQAALGNLPPMPETNEKPSHEQIARRAYERWEDAGRQPGMADLDWIRAEQELTQAHI